MFRSKLSRETMRQMAKRTEKERLDKLKKKEKNRKRPNTIAFRMSDEERRLFEDRVAMSGLLKQDFIIQSLLFSNVQFLGSTIAIKKNGLSFALSKDDPFVCIDLDRVDDSFRDFLNDFNDTYREVSQSGKGLHIFAKGVIAKNFNNQIEKVEMYQENRCIAMTGNIRKFGSMTVRTIKPKQKELHKYYKLFAPKDSIKEAIRKYQVMDDRVPDCNKVIEIMCRYNAKAKALFEGSNTSGDPSKDDFVLLLFLNSFTHGNADMMKEIFLRSALNRIGDKSKRRTEAGYLRYLDESIRKALQGGNQRYWDYNYHRKKGGYSLE